ncbi:TPA: chloride ion channel protein, partial [Escherichia coli]|nr:chloride ion channel protein [Escherichia coli]
MFHCPFLLMHHLHIYPDLRTMFV